MPEQSDGGVRERRPHPELAAEQRYLDRAYGRLDEMRKAASRVAEGYGDVGRGGTHQARLERDAAAAHTRRRLAALNIGNAPLCFGRIDLEPEPGDDRPEDDRYYIGRVSVTEADQTPLVVDWRAPVAEPFYRATAVEPMGVVRRRHFQTHGRELIGIDDEVFDSQAADQAGFTIVGEAALLAALERHRTGRMSDIVATIQAEQDEAVRAPLPGILVVAGGPGTGKTAVALHRAAYLLYTHRRRLASRGVLLVGPSPIFLRYIDEVLPSLGEDDVQLTTVAGIKPQLRARAAEIPEVAALKGDARMAQVIARALRDRERPVRDDVVVVLDGHPLRLRRADSARIVERVRRRRGTHNERRPAVSKLALDHLRDQYRRSLIAAYERDARRLEADAELPLDAVAADDEMLDVPVAAALARGERAPDEWEAELTARLRRSSEVRTALERMWPVLTGAELVHDLFSFPALIRSASDGILTREEQRLLERSRSSNVRNVAWTDADVALVDEADALLGPPESGRPRRRRRRRSPPDSVLQDAARVVEELGLGAYTTAAEVVERYGGGAPPSEDGVGEPRTYGHVLVDEAQDLTAMQWRMVGRRCPSGSMTLVGDFGQSSKPGALHDWDAVRAELPGDEPARVVTLTVNYRTPAEIMDLADRVVTTAAPGVEPARSVRSTGRPPQFVATADAGKLVSVAADVARNGDGDRGTTALIAPRELHDDLVSLLADVGAVAGSADAVDAPIAVVDASDAKGLEFDHVVVVEPGRLVNADAAGLRLLYTALTRATQTLTVAHAAPLPEALQPAAASSS
ncbi:MAG TPA: UvrD-helicase domain-containing protein [Acidimicrobiia bacterium]|nr:UvrD-helicase domain-containing protein [Acidimicrobiia bacterium]